MPEPFVLYASKRFVDRTSKALGLGLIVRKPLIGILKKMGVRLEELDRDGAKEVLERLSGSKGMTVSAGQLIKSLTLALLTPTTLLYALSKKIIYGSGAETEDAVMLEFYLEIPRAFRPSLFYYMWLVVPMTDDGGRRARELLKAVVGRVGAEPLTDDEWEGLQPIIEKLRGQLEVRGLTENLWRAI